MPIRLTTVLLLAVAASAAALCYDDAYVVGRGNLEAEFRADYADAGVSDAAAFALTGSYGLLALLEVSLSLPAAASFSSEGDDQFGLGDVGVGAKALVFGKEDSATAIAVAPAVVFPTGDAEEGLGSDATAVSGVAILTFGAGDRVLCHLNAAYDYALPREGKNEDMFSALAGVNVTVFGPLTLGAEYVSDLEPKPTDEGDKYASSAGAEVAYAFTGRLCGDAGVSVGLGAADGDTDYTLGLTWTVF